MARIESGKVQLNRSVTPASELVEAAVGRARQTLNGHSVSVSVPPGDILIAADADLIELAVRHLLDNAAKYSATGAPIEVSVCQDDGGAILQVIDSGPGIPEAEQGRIFDKFHRAPSTSPETPGTGIGLHIVREIVKAHGGHVWVESRPGEGARFSIMLPVAAKAGADS
jgi:two-component system sensor histidine kinase KdpD